MLKTLGISEQTHYRWRKAYGQLSPDEARRLRELEAVTRRLKKHWQFTAIYDCTRIRGPAALRPAEPPNLLMPLL